MVVLPKRQSDVTTHRKGDDVGLLFAQRLDEVNDVIGVPLHGERLIRHMVGAAGSCEIERDAPSQMAERVQLVEPHRGVEWESVNEYGERP